VPPDKGQRVDVVILVFGQFGLVDLFAVQAEAVGEPGKGRFGLGGRSPAKPIFSRTRGGRTIRPSASISTITDRLIRSRSARTRSGEPMSIASMSTGQLVGAALGIAFDKGPRLAAIDHVPAARRPFRLLGIVGFRTARKAAGIETRAFPSTFW
jgi:hypothetical protein